MKLNADARNHDLTIAACGDAHLIVGARRFSRSLLISTQGIDPDWGPEHFDALATTHLQQLLASRCDILLLGAGARQRFPAPALLRPLIEAGVALESMDTAAACRTFNILVAEGRSVAAGLIITPSPDPAA